MANDEKAKSAEPSKGEMRKAQILAAAADCFRREGFRGASMLKISAAAGMSPGHVFHYFKRKEDIVEAVAARELAEQRAILENMRSSSLDGDIVPATVDKIDALLHHFIDRERTSLWLEIVSESTRNATIAALLDRYNEEFRRAFEGEARNVYAQLGRDDESTINSRYELFFAVFVGLSMRSHTVQSAQSIDLDMLRRVIKVILNG